MERGGSRKGFQKKRSNILGKVSLREPKEGVLEKTSWGGGGNKPFTFEGRFIRKRAIWKRAMIRRGEVRGKELTGTSLALVERDSAKSSARGTKHVRKKGIYRKSFRMTKEKDEEGEKKLRAESRRDTKAISLSEARSKGCRGRSRGRIKDFRERRRVSRRACLRRSCQREHEGGGCSLGSLLSE